MARVGPQRHKKNNVWMQGVQIWNIITVEKNDLRPWRKRQLFSSSRIYRVFSCIKSACGTDGRWNNVGGAFLYTVGRAARGKGREYNNCLKQRTQLPSGNINKRGTYIVCVCVCVYTPVFQHCNQDFSFVSAFYSQLHHFQQTNANRKEGGVKIKKKIRDQQASWHEDFPSKRVRNHGSKVLKVVLLNQGTVGHWCTTRFSVEKWLCNIHGKNPVVLISK
jgi:hypothetical protein